MKEGIANNVKEASQHPLIATLNFLGGISGLLAGLTIVFYGGAMIEKLRTIDSRVSALEHTGSSAVREHVKEDDARELAILQRVIVLEEAVKRLTSIEGDVREIKATMRMLVDVKKP